MWHPTSHQRWAVQPAGAADAAPSRAFALGHTAVACFAPSNSIYTCHDVILNEEEAYASTAALQRLGALDNARTTAVPSVLLCPQQLHHACAVNTQCIDPRRSLHRVLQAAKESKKQSAEAYEAEKQAALDALSATIDEPRKLWAMAIDIVAKYTTAKNVYVAAIVDPEEPDWSPPEDAEAPDVETDDEGEAPKPAEGEGEEAPPAEEAPAEGEAAPPKPKIPRKPDYSKKMLSYVAACADQAFIATKDIAR